MIYQKLNQGSISPLHVSPLLKPVKLSPKQEQVQEQQLTEIRRNFYRNIKRVAR